MTEKVTSPEDLINQLFPLTETDETTDMLFPEDTIPTTSIREGLVGEGTDPGPEEVSDAFLLKMREISAAAKASRAETEGDEEKDEGYDTNWVDGMSFQDAIAQYKDMRASAGQEGSRFSTSAGQLIYEKDDGTKEMVLMPTPSDWDTMKSLWPFNEFGPEDVKADIPLSAVAGAGVRESFHDLDEMLSAGVDYFGAKTGLYDSDLLASSQEKSVEVNTSGSILDAIVADGFPALVMGGGTGALVFKSMQTAPKVLQGLYKVAPKAMSRAGQTVRGTTTAVSGELAATATTGTDEGSFFEIFSPEDLNLSDDEKGKLIAHRMNVLTEGMILGGVLGGAVLGTKAVGMAGYDFLASGIVDIFRPGAIERKIYDDVSRELAGIGSTATPQEVAAVQGRIVEILKENKSVMVKTLADLEANRNMTFDTVTSLIRGSDGTPLNPSTLTASRAGAVNTVGQTPIKVDGENTTLDTKIQEPVNALQDDLAAQRVELGGETPAQEVEVMQAATDTMVDQSGRVVDQAQGNLQAAQAKFDSDVQAVLTTGVADDIELADQLKQLEGKYPDELAQLKIGNRESIGNGLRNAYEAISNEKNRLYREVTGGKVDPQGLIDMLDQLDPSYFDPAKLGLPSNSMFGQFMSRYKSTKQLVDDLTSQLDNPKLKEEARNSILDQLGPDPDNAVTYLMADFFEAEGLDFGALYTQVRPSVSRSASDLFATATPEAKAAGRVMRDFVRYIDIDAVDFAGKSVEGLADKANAAKNFYKTEYAEFFAGDGVLGQYARLYDGTIGRTQSGDLMARATGSEFGVRDYNEALENLVKGDILTSGNTSVYQNVADLLGKNLNGETLGNPTELFDYMMLDVVQQFHAKVRSGGMAAVDVEGMINALNKHAEVVSEVFPQKTQTIRAFIFELEAVKGSSADLEAKLANAAGAATLAKEKLQDSVLSRFWDNKGTPSVSEMVSGTEIRPSSNPQSNFVSIFTDKEALNRMDDLLIEIDNLPKGNYAKSEGEIVMDGLKMSFNRFISDKLETASRNLTGGKELSVAQADKILAEGGSPQILGLARKIYADSPEWVEALELSTTLARDSSVLKRATPNPAQSATNFNINAQTATNRLIYTFVGPLSRAGTRIKAGAAGVIGSIAPNVRAAEITARLYADPEYFLELAGRFNKNPKDPLVEQLLTRYLIGASVKVDMDDDNDATVGAAARSAATLLPFDETVVPLVEAGFASVPAISGAVLGR